MLAQADDFEGMHIIVVSDGGPNSAMHKEEFRGIEYWKTAETLFNRMSSHMAPKIEGIQRAGHVRGNTHEMPRIKQSDFVCRYMGGMVGDVISARISFGGDIPPFTQHRLVVE